MKKILALSIIALAATLAVSAQKAAPAKNAAKSTSDWLDKALASKTQVQSVKTKGIPYVSDVYKKGSAPGAVDLDVTGLNELVLVTWATADGSNFDHATWADAVLVDKNGKEYRLDQEKFKVKKIEGDWFRLTNNFSGEPFSIGSKKYKHGVLEHANGLLVVDIKGRDIVRFKSDIGIDNGAGEAASAIFKVLPTSGVEEGKALVAANPQVQTELLGALGVSADNWLTTPGTALEKAALAALIKQLSNKKYFDAEIARVDALPTLKQQILGYLELNKKAQKVLAVQEQVQWLNPAAVEKAYADFSAVKGFDKAKYDAKMAEFRTLTKGGIEGVYALEPKALENAGKALTLKREILLSNPALDIDKILVTKYNLGAGARSAMAPEMGTQPNNWSCQLSGARSGFDPEIMELSNLRGEKVNKRVIYKPQGNGVVTDVQLHWDADRMMFTGNDDKGRFQVYEVGIDGKNAKQVSVVPETDLEFFEGTYLPSGKVILGTNVGYHGVPCVNGSDAVGNYALYDPQTQQMRRLTFDQDNNWNATVLQNGKVMYTRWEYTDLMHYYSRIVFTMNPDGTEQKAYFGSGAMFPNSTFDMQQLPTNTNRFIGVISGHHGIARSGRLIIFDPTKARKGVDGMIQELPHSNREIIPLVKDELVNGVWPQFIKPHPLTDNYFLVTAKLSPNSLWGVYLVDVFDNLTLIAEFEGEGLINPIPLKKRPVPAVIKDKVEMDVASTNGKTPAEATVFIQDIYEGEGLPGVPRGTVKELRVLSYEYAYLSSLSDHVNNGVQSGWDIKRELGRVKVNPDGSAIFNVPSNLPVALQPLDSTGAAIQLMRSWFVGMPGETVSCVGCHEDQNKIVPPKRSMASLQKPQKITPPEGGTRPMTFEAEIQPILDRACVACHNGEKLAGGIDYTKGRMYKINDWAGTREYSKSYLAFHPYFYRQGPEAEMAVLNPYEYNVGNSEMIQMLREGHHNVKLNDKEWERLITWVDFNLPYHGTFVAAPYKARDGKTYDQKQRRIELSQKYSGEPVIWEKELNSFMNYLEGQPKPTPEMPVEVNTKFKEIKVKNWPFDAAAAAQMVEGKTPRVIDMGNGEKITFVYIPAGTYVAGGDGKNGSPAPRKVTIKKGFWMADKEITNAQMRAMLPTHDSRYIGMQWKDHTTPGYPVDSAHLAATKISLNEAMEFAKLLSEKTGLKVALPTADQWEWAARAGAASDFWFGNRNTNFATYENMSDVNMNKMAVSGIDPKPMSKSDPWYPLQAYIPKDETVNDGQLLMTAPGSYKANAWGLYDVNGNVAEWTATPVAGTQEYVVKGGSWYDRAKKFTTATQRTFLPWHKVWNVGFRPIIED